MKIAVWKNATEEQRTILLSRPDAFNDPDVASKVSAIVKAVKINGDKAVIAYSKKFDRSTRKSLRVTEREINEAYQNTPKDLLSAMRNAKANIEKFHKAQAPKTTLIETMPGVKCGLVWRPIENIGLYIPAGTAPLFSALLMEALPAKIAGCKNIVLCSPPQRDGKVHPTILAAAKLCGLTSIYAVGGAQAIAAMAYGTETIPKADKIFGPGNVFVTTAKTLVSQDPMGSVIDMPAGPSEVLVIAEPSARADWVAADLLAQAEHDPSAQALLITTDRGFAVTVENEIEKQLQTLPRKDIAARSLSGSRIIVVSDLKTAFELSNRYAPEHLILHNKDAAKYLPLLQNAGSVFLGPLTPESSGDYASGTNHVLPTCGYVKAISGINLQSFLKSMTVQSLTPQGLNKLGPTLVTMAKAEGLRAHANAVTIRMEK